MFVFPFAGKAYTTANKPPQVCLWHTVLCTIWILFGGIADAFRLYPESITYSDTKRHGQGFSAQHQKRNQTTSNSPNAVGDVFSQVDAGGLLFSDLRGPLVPRKGYTPGAGVVQTNRFYANLFLADQKQPVFCHPYSVAWTGCDVPNGCHHGMGVSRVDEKDARFDGGSPAQWFLNPTDRHSVVLSAAELGSGATLTTEKATSWSIVAVLSPPGRKPVMRLPLLQGMGFVTASYVDAKPLIQTLVGFRSWTLASRTSTTAKYEIRLLDDTLWVMYVTLAPGSSQKSLAFENRGNSTTGTAPFTGIIQIAEIGKQAKGMEVYDRAAGTYAVDASISGQVDGKRGRYSIRWRTEGPSPQNLVMFALPHHVESMADETKRKLTNIRLRTTTKGLATAITGNTMTLEERNLPTEIGFDPWSAGVGNGRIRNSTIRNYILEQAKREINSIDLSGRMARATSYDAGKLIETYAQMVGVTASVLGERKLAETGIQKMRGVFATWVNNKQENQLVYETGWGGIVTYNAYRTNNLEADYGNAIYSDHHFHYGYWVYAAAVLASLDPSWLKDTRNKNWVNSLIRDYANPSLTDKYFPFSRAFDWYHGHSWADGLHASWDGKNQESTSEDANSLFAIKLWGLATGDATMVARANLQLAVLKRSLDNYYLLRSNNVNLPSRFLGNKIVGIRFENKVDHATFFGKNPEYIHGIHMLPITPISAYSRSKEFATEEWRTVFKGNFTATKQSWTSLLYANQAIFDPRGSYNFFSSPRFHDGLLMESESRAYYLAYSAVLAGL